MLFTGGAAAIAGWDDAGASPERFGTPATPPEGVAWDAFVESVAKYAAALALSVPWPTEFVLSGRLAQVGAVQHAMRQRLRPPGPPPPLGGGGGAPAGGDTGPGGARLAGAPAGAVPGEVATYVERVDNHPAAVRALAWRAPLGGSPPAVLRRVRDPVRLARALVAGGIPAPAVRLSAPPRARSATRWLVKPRASGGGSGIVPWRGRRVAAGSYLQQRIAGVPGSILFAADGRHAVTLGVSRLLSGDGAFGASGFRYCGNILCGVAPR